MPLVAQQSTLASNCDFQDWASLYVLEALSAEERVIFEAHLAGCPACQAEVASFRSVAGAMATSVEPAQPNAELRNRLMQRVTQAGNAQRGPGVLYDEGGVFIARPEEMGWGAGQIPGVFAKVLFNDLKRAYSTTLVRLVAGTHYPSHHHAGVEELFLLEGDVTVGKVEMRPGDYCRGEEGSVHEEIVTKGGCLFIATSSHHDELLT